MFEPMYSMFGLTATIFFVSQSDYSCVLMTASTELQQKSSRRIDHLLGGVDIFGAKPASSHSLQTLEQLIFSLINNLKGFTQT